MAIAALFIIGEIFTQGFFLLWFGIGAAVAGICAILGLGVGWQLGSFVVVSGLLFVAIPYVFQAVLYLDLEARDLETSQQLW